MLPLVRDPATIPSITVVYSAWSSVVFISTAYILMTSDMYLKFGSFEILPLFLVYITSEFFKWAFIRSKFHSVSPYRPKESTGLLSEVFSSLGCLTAKNVLKGTGLMVAGVAAYFIAAIFFGAAITEGHLGTLMFSCLLTVLTVLPMCLHLGTGSVTDFVDGARPQDDFHWLLHCGVYSCWLGAWLGAFVIPLDWNRPWQEWPTPCNIGAISAQAIYYFGSCVYHLLSNHSKTLKYT